jgi:hypothetical protein
VAGRASHLAFAAVVEGEVVGMEQGRLPRIGCVAVIAFQAEETRMDLGFGVTGDTASRCIAEFVFGVAALTGQVRVFSTERENLLVLEAVHAVVSIVALQAVRAVGRGVFGQKIDRRGLGGRGVLRVAGDAGLLVKFLGWAVVAGGARQGLVVVAGFVLDQVEAGFTVIEYQPLDLPRFPGDLAVAFGAVQAKHAGMLGWFGVAGGAVRFRAAVFVSFMAVRALNLGMFAVEGEGCQVVVKTIQGGLHGIKIAALVFGVAGGALFHPGHPAVRAAFLLELSAYLRVAILAEPRLFRLKRLVTEGAVVLKISMRAEFLQSDSWGTLSGYRTGVKYRSAGKPGSDTQTTQQKQRDGNGKAGDERGPFGSGLRVNFDYPFLRRISY